MLCIRVLILGVNEETINEVGAKVSEGVSQ